jgi:hypothetical protein
MRDRTTPMVRTNYRSVIALTLLVLISHVSPVNGQTRNSPAATERQESNARPQGSRKPDQKTDEAETASENFKRDRRLHTVANAYVKEFVSVDISVLDPRNVSDIYGRRVSNRYLALQVTIKNDNPTYRFLIQDVSMDLTEVYQVDDLVPDFVKKAQEEETAREEAAKNPNARKPPSPPRRKYQPSSNNLSLVQGVAEKGQMYDRRNFTLRLLRGMGSVAAGLIGVTTFGSSYAPSVAVFNGPLVTSFGDVFPDQTINQLIRLNDKAFRANTLVPSQQAMVVVAFLDLAMLIPSRDLRKKFANEPLSIAKQIDFRSIVAAVDGTFITEVFEESPEVTSASIAADQLAHFQDPKPTVKGTLIGHGLTNSTLKLDNDGLRISADSTEAEKINFTITSDKPVSPGTSLLFIVIRNGKESRTSLPASYTISPPVLTGLSEKTGEVGKVVAVTLEGSGFNGFSKITFDQPASGISAHINEVATDGTTIKAEFTIASDAKPGDVRVRVENNGSRTIPQTFTVIAKPEEKKEPNDKKTQKKSKTPTKPH